MTLGSVTNTEAGYLPTVPRLAKLDGAFVRWTNPDTENGESVFIYPQP